MRTVILNTLDAAFAKKDVFYRAFAPDQIVWFDRGLDDLQDVAATITMQLQQQMIRQDYHLVVLVALEQFQFSEFADARNALKSIITAHINKQIMPKLEHDDMLPVCVTIIFTYFRNRLDSEKGRELYTTLFQIDPTQPLEKLCLTYRKRGAAKLSQLDMSDTLSGVLQSEAPTIPIHQDASEPKLEQADELLLVAQSLRPERAAVERHATVQLENVESLLKTAIGELQEHRTASDPDDPYIPIAHELPFQMKEASLANADLQINLSRMIHEVSQNKTDPEAAAKEFKMHSHEETELAMLLDGAQDSIQHYRYATGSAYYYELKEPYKTEDAADVVLNIRSRLRKEVDNVPGIRDAMDSVEEKLPDAPGASETSSKSSLERRVRSSWFLVGREKKRFQMLYQVLREQYNPGRVLEDQKMILDICSDEFMAWRAGKRNTNYNSTDKPTLEKRPEVSAERRSALIAARERCSEGVLERLNDFADIREEGASLYTEFRALTRLWAPDRQKQNSSLFFRFSFLSAIVFTLLMVLPFILIETVKTDFIFPVAAMFGVYYGAFLVLYTIGVLRWMREMCLKIHNLSEKLEHALESSAKERKQSILNAVETYGGLLPECLLQQMNLEAIESADTKNAHLEHLRILHLGYLNDAMVEIQNLRTALRLPAQSRIKGKYAEIHFDQPPYSPDNQAVYMLFNEGGGKR